MTVNALIDDAFKRGQASGWRIPLDDSGYGAGRHAVIVLAGKSMQAVRAQIRSRRGGRSGDNPGQIYAWYCKPIAIHRGDSGEWQAVCIASSYYDI